MLVPRSIKTPNAGATRQRDDTLALFRRHIKALESGEDKRLFKGLHVSELGFNGPVILTKYLRHAVEWQLEANDRQNAKGGGLGKKRKAA